MPLHKDIHQAHTTVGMVERIMSVYGMGRPYIDGKTMTQNQFVKPFKPVSSGTGLVSG
jgi:hypothetical protein